MDAIQYTLKVNDKIVALNDAGEPLVFDDKESVREYADEWRKFVPSAEVQIMHRRVIYQPWFSTTP